MLDTDKCWILTSVGECQILGIAKYRVLPSGGYCQMLVNDKCWILPSIVMCWLLPCVGYCQVLGIALYWALTIVCYCQVWDIAKSQMYFKA